MAFLLAVRSHVVSLVKCNDESMSFSEKTGRNFGNRRDGGTLRGKMLVSFVYIQSG